MIIKHANSMFAKQFFQLFFMFLGDPVELDAAAFVHQRAGRLLSLFRCVYPDVIYNFAW